MDEWNQVVRCGACWCIKTMLMICGQFGGGGKLQSSVGCLLRRSAAGSILLTVVSFPNQICTVYMSIVVRGPSYFMMNIASRPIFFTSKDPSEIGPLRKTQWNSFNRLSGGPATLSRARIFNVNFTFYTPHKLGNMLNKHIHVLVDGINSRAVPVSDKTTDPVSEIDIPTLGPR